MKSELYNQLETLATSCRHIKFKAKSTLPFVIYLSSADYRSLTFEEIQTLLGLGLDGIYEWTEAVDKPSWLS